MRSLLINILLTLIILGGGGYLIHRANQQVKLSYAVPDKPPEILLMNPPQWMPKELAYQIIKSVTPADPKSAVDPTLLKNISETLARNPWIRSVDRIERLYERSPGDTIRIFCEYRAPAAFFHYGDKLYLVDSRGVRLPDTFPDKPLPEYVRNVNGKISLRIVFGMSSPPPTPGQTWQGKDVQAGLDLVKTLFEENYARDILSINVKNYAGRVNAMAPQILLHTQFGTEIRWGEPIMQEYHAEITPARKIQRLQQIDAKYGRVDANHSWIDIRLDNAKYPENEAPQALAE